MTSKMQTVTKFEVLPNEILIECFEYLNGLDIFYSFYQLNNRFDKLVESISLQLNFEHARKNRFDQFCTTMLSNSEIRRQVYSLKLSNEDTCGQIQAFLSCFSFDEFPSLRSLTLTGVEKKNFEQLKVMLPLLSKSCFIHLIGPDYELKGELSLEQIHRVPIIPEKLTCHLPFIFQLSSTTHLTLSDCACQDLSKLLEYLPMLKYLNVRDISYSHIWTNYYGHFSNHCAVHLKQLILIDFDDGFTNFEMLMKQTPNLKSLTASFREQTEVVNADRWEDLITSSLPQLTVFKLEFICNYSVGGINGILDIVKNFHSDFWQKQHHWYIECLCKSTSAIIYTIPRLSHNTAYYHDLKCESKTFNSVKDLHIFHMDVTKEYEHHFTEVTTLRLTGEPSASLHQNIDILSRKEYFQSLKMIVNLSKLKNLEFMGMSAIDMPFLLFEILKEAPKLSSLTIPSHDLPFLFGNDELCKYLNKMIKKLSLKVVNSISYINDVIAEEFYEIFSNIEQLSCEMKEPHNLLILSKRLPKLSTIKAYFNTDDNPIDLSAFEEEAKKLNLLFRIECRENMMWYEVQWNSSMISNILYETHVTIWIGTI